MLQAMLQQIKTQPETVEFEQVMAVIASAYQYSPSDFSNGLGDASVLNKAGTNEGSCRIFAFARLNGLNEQETLACFGRYYREDVMQNPAGADHANIRTFMQYGWKGIVFAEPALTKVV